MTPELSYGKESLSLTNGVITQDSSTALALVAVEYQYGLLENLSVGLATLYGDASVEPAGGAEYSYSGLGDLWLISRGYWSPSGASHLRFRYGFDLGYSPEAEVDSSNVPQNLNSGRTRITPYFGFDFDAGENGVFGFKVSREILLGDQKIKLSNGNTFESRGNEPTVTSLFYEYQSQSWVAGASIYHMVNSDLKIDGTAPAPQLISTGTNLYGVFSVTESIVLIPKLSYGSTFSNQFSGQKIESYNMWNVGAGARFTF